MLVSMVLALKRIIETNLIGQYCISCYFHFNNIRLIVSYQHGCIILSPHSCIETEFYEVLLVPKSQLCIPILHYDLRNSVQDTKTVGGPPGIMHFKLKTINIVCYYVILSKHVILIVVRFTQLVATGICTEVCLYLALFLFVSIITRTRTVVHYK